MSQNPPPFPPQPPAKKGLSTGCIVGIVIAVVAVIAIPVLAGIAYSIFGSVQTRAKITAASAQAHGIHIGMMQYASDHEGAFPTGEHDANEALRKLLPKYVEIERPFHVAGCAWHDDAPNKKPDEDIGAPPEYAKALEAGENHWAYVSGLTTQSPDTTPIMADGFSDEIGTYSKDASQRGGVWRASKAIVCYASGMIRSESVDPKSLRVIRDGVDLFAPANFPKGTKVLNPK